MRGYGVREVIFFWFVASLVISSLVISHWSLVIGLLVHWSLVIGLLVHWSLVYWSLVISLLVIGH